MGDIAFWSGMKLNKCNYVAASLLASGTCNDCDFADSFGYLPAFLCPFAGASRLAGRALGYVRIKERFFRQL